MQKNMWDKIDLKYEKQIHKDKPRRAQCEIKIKNK